MSPGSNSQHCPPCCIVGAQLFSRSLPGAIDTWRAVAGARVNPSLTALLKHTARCPLLNSVFLWADFYLHLKGMLIVQMCKQPPNSSIKGNALLGEFCSRNQAEMRKFFVNSRLGPFECCWSEKLAQPRCSPPGNGSSQGSRKANIVSLSENSVLSSILLLPQRTCVTCDLE